MKRIVMDGARTAVDPLDIDGVSSDNPPRIWPPDEDEGGHFNWSVTERQALESPRLESALHTFESQFAGHSTFSIEWERRPRDVSGQWWFKMTCPHNCVSILM